MTPSQSKMLIAASHPISNRMTPNTTMATSRAIAVKGNTRGSTIEARPAPRRRVTEDVVVTTKLPQGGTGRESETITPNWAVYGQAAHPARGQPVKRVRRRAVSVPAGG
jgi:hypothetical protein